MLCEKWMERVVTRRMKKTVTLGQFLDLIDSNRESDEYVNIMSDGKVLVRGMVCYDAWEEDRLINSIGINKDCEYEVWLEQRVRRNDCPKT